MSTTMEFTSGTGRMVFGNAYQAAPKTEDDNKTPQRDKVTGEVIMEFCIGVAYRKDDPEAMAHINELRAFDRATWPQYHGPDGLPLPGVEFADKIKDGDGFNKKSGKPYSVKDGWAGCFIVTYVTQFAPEVVYWNGTQWAQLAAGLRPGDYVRVNGTTKSNGNTDPKRTAGMYRNLNKVAKIGDGPLIVVGADANEVFGGAPVLPPGATTTPQAPAAPLPSTPADPMTRATADGWTAHPTSPGYYFKGQEVLTTADLTVRYAAPPPAPVVPAAPPPAPAAPAAPPPAPYDGFMQAPPPAPAAPAAPPPAPAKVMLPAANGNSYESYIAAGWNDAQLVQHGLMAG